MELASRSPAQWLAVTMNLENRLYLEVTINKLERMAGCWGGEGQGALGRVCYYGWFAWFAQIHFGLRGPLIEEYF
jgi:hypothetical protein